MFVTLWIGLFLFILPFELILGIAWIGGSGDNMVIERAKSPRQYWFTIAVHVLIGIGLPLVIWYSFRHQLS